MRGRRPARTASESPWTSARIGPGRSRPGPGSQRWRDLLFAHWPVDPERLRPHIPEGLTLDCHTDAAWVSLTPFRLEGLRPRGTPRPPLGLRVPRAELPDVRDEGAEARRLLLQPRRRPHGRSDGRASGVSPALLPRSDAGRHRVRWHDRLSEPPDRFGAPRRVPGVVSTRAPDVAAARGARHDRPLAHPALLACTRSTARDDSIERRSTTRRGRSSPSRRRSSGTRSPPPPGSSCRHSPR